MSTGIAAKVTMLLCAIVMTSSGAIGLTMYWRFSQTLVQQELRDLSALARNKSARFVAQIDAFRADASFMAQSPVVRGMIRARQAEGVDPKLRETELELRHRMAAVFTELLHVKPDYCQARLIGLEDDGREIVRVERVADDGQIRVVPQAELQQKGQEPYFAATLRLAEHDVHLSELSLNRAHGQVAEPRTPVLQAAAPVYGPDGNTAAILVINRLMQPLIDSLRSGVKAGHTMLLANDQGEYVAHPDAGRTFAFDFGRSSRIQEDYPGLAEFFTTDRQQIAAIVVSSRRRERTAIGVYKSAFDPQQPARFVAFALRAPYDEVVAESTRIRNQSLWISSALLLVSVAVGYMASHSVTRPLRQIASAAEAFGRGEPDVALPTQAGDETGILARSLEQMMSRLVAAKRESEHRAAELDEVHRKSLDLLDQVEAARQTAVAAEQATRDQAFRTQAILDNATDAIITIDVNGEVESFNLAAERIFGYAASEVIGKNVNMLMPSPYHEEHDQYIRNDLNTGISKIIGVGREVEGLRSDGSTFPLDLSISEVKLGNRRMFTGIIRDISQLKRALQQLSDANLELVDRGRQIERFNVDLRRSNEELAQFAYVASHDLQEPLRKVTAFCQMLQNEYNDRLDDDARKYIAFAVDGATRMKTLVQDLLTYSRVSTQGKPLTPLDADDACAAAIDNLAAAIEESGAEVTREPLPVIQADQMQLVRLFQNLIHNAIKYRTAEPPRIQVGADEVGGEWVFRVRDNGIGIDPQFHRRIFVIFQRLHAREDYSGTGIGLAVCKRIVERFGGRIWVESREGAGSEFCFALPKMVEPPEGSQEGDSTYGRDIRQVVSTTD